MDQNKLKATIDSAAPQGGPNKNALFDAVTKATQKHTGRHVDLPYGRINFDRYQDHVHDFDIQTNLEYRAASSQTAGELFKNAMIQVGAEVGLGTLEGIGYLLDWETAGELISGAETDFGNWFSDVMRDAKQSVMEDYAPIFDTPESEGFAPWNGRWWAKNAANIATTLTLMIPAAGAAKIAGVFGKAIGTGLGATKVGRAAGKTKILKDILTTNGFTKQTAGIARAFNTAIASRYMENTLEARETYESMLAQGATSEQAGDAAAKTWWRNSALLATDFIQYSKLMGRRGIIQAMTEKTRPGSLIKQLVTQGIIEAGEESYQYIASQEAQKQVLGIDQDKNRLRDYLRDEELWTSAFLGAFGGMAFATIGRYFDGAPDAVGRLFNRMKGVPDDGAVLPLKQQIKKQITKDSKIVNEADETELEFQRIRSFNTLAIDHLLRQEGDTFRDTIEEIITGIQEDENLTDEQKEAEVKFLQKNLKLFNERLQPDIAEYLNKGYKPEVAIAAAFNNYEANEGSDLLFELVNSRVKAKMDAALNRKAPNDSDFKWTKNLIETVKASFTSEEDFYKGYAINKLLQVHREAVKESFIKKYGKEDANIIFERLEQVNKNYVDTIKAPIQELLEGEFAEKYAPAKEQAEEFSADYAAQGISYSVEESLLDNSARAYLFSNSSHADMIKTLESIKYASIEGEIRGLARKELEYFNTPEGIQEFENKLAEERKAIKAQAEEFYAGLIGEIGYVKKNGVNFKAVKLENENLEATYDVFEVVEDPTTGEEILGEKVEENMLAVDLVRNGYKANLSRAEKTPPPPPPTPTPEEGFENLRNLRDKVNASSLYQAYKALEKAVKKTDYGTGMTKALSAIRKDSTIEDKTYEEAVDEHRIYHYIDETKGQLQDALEIVEKALSAIKAADNEIASYSLNVEPVLDFLVNILSPKIEEAFKLIDAVENSLAKIEKPYEQNNRGDISAIINPILKERTKLSKEVVQSDKSVPTVKTALDATNTDLTQLVLNIDDILNDIENEEDLVTDSSGLSIMDRTPAPFSKEMKESLARNPSETFTGLAGSSHPTGNRPTDETTVESQRRYFRFNIYNNVEDYIIKLVKADEYEGLFEEEDLKRLKASKSGEMPIVAIFTNKQGQPIDMMGNPIADNVSLNNIDKIANAGIFTMYRTTTLVSDTGNLKTSDPAAAKAEQKEFKKVRADIEKDLNAGKDVYFAITGKSDGIALDTENQFYSFLEYDPDVNPNVKGFNLNILISDRQVLDTFGEDAPIDELKGQIVAEVNYGTHRERFQVIPRNLTAEEVQTVKALFEELADEYEKQGKYTPKVKSLLEQLSLFTPIFNINSNIRMSRQPKQKVSQVFNGTFFVNDQPMTLREMADNFDTQVSPYITRFAISLGTANKTGPVNLPFLAPDGSLQTQKFNNYTEFILNNNILQARKPPLPPRENMMAEPLPLANVYAIHDYTQKLRVKNSTKPRPPKPNNKGRKNRAHLDKAYRPGPYELENIKEAEQWFKERFPQIPFEIVKGLIDQRSWGRFTRAGQVLLSDIAARGTVYHEAFHVVSQLFLNPQEQANLYNEIRKDFKGKSFVINNNKTVVVGESTSNADIEEVLAEMFSDYVLTGELPQATRVKGFLEKLLDFIKKILGLSVHQRDQIFNRINTGYYAEKTPIIASPKSYNKEASITSADIKDLDDAYSYYFNYYMMSQVDFSRVEEVINKKINLDEIQEEVKAEFEALLEDFKDELSNNPAIQETITATEYLLDNFKDFADRHLVRATRYNLVQTSDFSRNRAIELGQLLPELLENEEDAALLRGLDSLISENSIHISQKKTAARIVRLALSSITASERYEVPGVIDGNSTLYVPKTNRLGFYVNADYTQMFAKMADKLSETTSLEEVLSVINGMEDSYDGDLNDLIGEEVINEQGVKVKFTEDFEVFYPIRQILKRLSLLNPNKDAYTMQSAVRAAQTFSKHKLQSGFQITYVDPETRVIKSKWHQAKPYYAIFQKEKSIKAELSSRSRGVQVRGGDPIVTLQGSQELVSLINYKRLSTPRAIRILKYIGVDFSNPAQLNAVDIRTIRKAVKQIVADLKKYKSYNLFHIKNEELKRSLVELAVRNDLALAENANKNLENRNVYNNVLYSFSTLVMNSLNTAKNKADLARKLPQFFTEGGVLNTWGQGSIVLSQLSRSERPDKRINIILDQGRITEGDRISFEKLPPELKAVSKFNNIIAGRHPMVRPSDNKLERLLNLKDFIHIKEGETDKFLRAFKMALTSELAVFLESERLAGIKNMSNISADNLSSLGIMFSILDKQLTSPEKRDIAGKLKLLKNKPTGKSIATIVESSLIENTILAYINNQAERYIEEFQNTKIIEFIPSSGMYLNRGLNNTSEETNSSYTEEELLRVMKAAQMNRIIGLNEQFRLLYGHPAQFKGMLDLMKRLSGAVGTKKIAFTDTVINDFIDTKLNRPDNKTNKGIPYVNTRIFKTPKARSRQFETYRQMLGDKALPYQSFEETDGGGFISLPEYRELLFRTGDWNVNLEILYQWEMQGGYKKGKVKMPMDSPYTDVAGEIFTAADISNLNTTFTTLKPQYFGPILEQSNLYVPNVMFKLGITPILPSLTEQFPQLAELHKHAMETGTGLYLPDTAVKFGFPVNSNNQAIDIYKRGKTDGENTESLSISELMDFDVYYKYFGIQQDAAFSNKDKTPTGTQVVSFIEATAFEDGEIKDEASAEKVMEFRALNDARLKMGVQQLKDRFELQNDGASGLTFKTTQARENFIAFLVGEAHRRDLTDSVIDSIELLTEDINLDKALNKKKVFELLSSIADRMTVSRPRKGAPRVQVPSTFFQTSRQRKFRYIEGDKVYDSTDLDFYVIEDENGRKVLKDMEVYLPHYFKELLEVDDVIDANSKLRELFGFRIPTQDMASIESIKVKGFLPKSAGETIIVPSEIVAKTGSDFDIDKLFLYFPHYIMDEGVPKYIEYIEGTSDEAINQRFERWFDETFVQRYGAIETIANLQQRASYAERIKDVIAKMRETFAAIDPKFFASAERAEFESLSDVYNYLEGRKDVETDPVIIADIGRFVKYLNELVQEAKEESKSLTPAITKEIERITNAIKDEQYEIFKSKSIQEQNGFKAVENRMIEVARDLVKLNPATVLQPTVTTELEEQADKIRELYEEEVELQLGDVADIIKETKIGEQFTTSKLQVGRPALSGKHHNLTTQWGLVFNNEYSYKEEGEWYSATVTNLPLNYDKNGLITLGKQTNVQRERIAYINSQIVSAFLDAGNNPFAFSLNITGKGFGVASFLIRAGLNLDTWALFINQPIIREFINKLHLNDAQLIGSTKLRADQIKDQIFDKYNEVVKAYRQSPVDKHQISKMSDARYTTMIMNASENNGDISQMSVKNIKDQLMVLNEYYNLYRMSAELTRNILQTRIDSESIPKSMAAFLSRRNEIDEYFMPTNQEQKGYIPSFKALNRGIAYGKGEFLRPYKETSDSIFYILRSFSKLFSHPNTAGIMESFVEEISKLTKYKYQDKARLLLKLEQEFLNFIIQTHHNLPQKAVSLMEDDKTAVGARILNIKTAFLLHDTAPEYMLPRDKTLYDRYYPYQEVIDKLYVNEDDGRYYVNFNTKYLEKEEYNRIYKMMIDLHNSGDPIVRELYEVQMLQSGLTDLSNSFYDILPSQIHEEYYEEAIGSFDESKVKGFFEHFALNNPNEAALFSKHEVKIEDDISNQDYQIEDEGFGPDDFSDFEGGIPLSIYENDPQYAQKKPEEVGLSVTRLGNTNSFKHAGHPLYFDGAFKFSEGFNISFRPYRNVAAAEYADESAKREIKAVKRRGPKPKAGVKTLISGGAIGADTVFTQEAMKAGYNYYSLRGEGVKEVTSGALRGRSNLRNINIENYRAKAKEVIDTLEGINMQPFEELKIRNIAIVEEADAVFAISQGKGTKNFWKDRGTMVGIKAAMLMDKPLYVFDQEVGSWYQYVKTPEGKQDMWVKMSQPPMLTKNFAGIGTRNLNDAGTKAIKALFEADEAYNEKMIKENKPEGLPPIDRSPDNC